MADAHAGNAWSKGSNVSIAIHSRPSKVSPGTKSPRQADLLIPTRKQSQLDRAIQLAEENNLSLAMANNNLDSVYAEMGRVNRRLGSRSKEEEPEPKWGALYPANAQYNSVQGNVQDYTMPSGEHDNSSANRSKRQRHR